jgi:hypothetical protein
MPCAPLGHGTRIFAHQDVLCATTGKLVAPPLPAHGCIFALISYTDLRLDWYSWPSRLKPCLLCRTSLKHSSNTLSHNRIISIIKVYCAFLS